jgi:hypothetical protein
MRATPCVETPVLTVSRVATRDPFGVPNDEGSNPAAKRPGDNLLGGFVMRLMHAAPVTGFSSALRSSELAPPSTAALPAAGCLGTCAPRPGFGVGQMQAFLSAHRPSRYQESCITRSERVGVNDPEIDSRQPIWIQIVGFDRHRSGHVQHQAPRIDEQCHGTHLLARIWNVPGEAQGQWRCTTGRGESHPTCFF